ncbi:hypothetical protein GN244_ATG17827 [Phytophthora infestans]|uniref:Uncharacterized protein n=1 Tax=Phytophthora infestans TaxID=4787 RepID=A0A833S8D0_PHYIN|nr:hypothetical protein GN244_ATG17827 [Phytophthora infestans]
MCRYLIQNRVDSVEGITGFDLEGYKYASSASSDETFVFTRTATELQKMKEKAATKTKTNPSAKYEAVNVEKKELEGDNDAEERPVRRSTRKKRKTV